jgi:hypothetical protein
MPTAHGAPGLRLRSDVWHRKCAQYEAFSLSEKATLLRDAVDPSTVSKIEHGSQPSAKFIAAAILALRADFDALFEITTGQVAA